jgi:hypothetical protein
MTFFVINSNYLKGDEKGKRDVLAECVFVGPRPQGEASLKVNFVPVVPLDPPCPANVERSTYRSTKTGVWRLPASIFVPIGSVIPMALVVVRVIRITVSTIIPCTSCQHKPD